MHTEKMYIYIKYVHIQIFFKIYFKSEVENKFAKISVKINIYFEIKKKLFIFLWIIDFSYFHVGKIFSEIDLSNIILFCIQL